jgi:hypothetical protein
MGGANGADLVQPKKDETRFNMLKAGTAAAWGFWDAPVTVETTFESV